MAAEKRFKAINLEHHLSKFSRSRSISPLKELLKRRRPGLVVLAGGLPSPDYFPFSSIGGQALVPDSFPLEVSESSSAFSWLWNMFGSSFKKEKTTTIAITKYPAAIGDLSLSTALQYSDAVAFPQLEKFMYEFVTKVFQPAYLDYTTMVHTGNTDGWNRVVVTLCNEGDAVLASEWTYPSALSTATPYGIKIAPVGIDIQGMRADSLRDVLQNWDATARGSPRPRLAYIVPIGQNPTGSTMGLVRKKEIYDICVEFDVIICEDDPYYFLQEGIYVPKAQRKAAKKISSLDDAEHYLANLEKSFLKVDYQGRVIRMDTYSKTFAPGARLGWFTCNPMFAERLERQGETTTQAPCGFGESLITRLLLEWKYDGYIRWLRALGTQYKARRDYLIDCLNDEFDFQLNYAHEGIWRGSEYYSASAKSNQMSEKFGNKTMFSFVPPTAGMYVWLKVHLENVPFTPREGEEPLEVQLFTKVAEAGVLIGPGWIFSANTATGGPLFSDHGHFRISFSNAQPTIMRQAMATFAKVMREFFEQ